MINLKTPKFLLLFGRKALLIWLVLFRITAVGQTYVELGATIEQNKAGLLLTEEILQKNHIKASDLFGLQLGGKRFIKDSRWFWTYSLGLSHGSYKFSQTHVFLDPMYGFITDTAEIKDHFYFIKLSTGVGYSIPLHRKLEIHCRINTGILYKLASARKTSGNSRDELKNNILPLAHDVFPFIAFSPSLSLNPGKRKNPWRIFISTDLGYWFKSTDLKERYNFSVSTGINYRLGG